MLELIPIMIPIVITDVINPVLFAAAIYALGTRKPYLTTGFLLFGWFLAYLVSGIVLAIGLDAIIEFFNNPRPIDFVIEGVIGVLLLWLGFRIMRTGDNPKKEKEIDKSENISPGSAFVFGVSLNLIGMPFALPYFAILDQILKADLGWVEGIGALFIYNILYLIPFVLPIFIRIFLREKSDAIFAKINEWMEKISKVIMPALLILLGIALLADTISFFATGKSLF